MPFIPKLAPGNVLAGRYRIERVIGEGGMSRVYLASDLKLPGKIWAVKESRNQPGLQMEKEAKLLISLNHHRLPRIVDFIKAEEEGYSFIVMDYIEGVHLDRYVKSFGGKLSTDILTRFGLQICEGLSYLHTFDPPVIHRDLKPSNLLVDGKGEIRFIDFGIARSFKEDQPEDTVKLGTIGFAAPEQYGGRQSDGRSDLYSLGAVLLYLGTGCGHSVWTREAEDIFGKNGHTELKPVLARLLQTSPDDRYETAEETGEALRMVVSKQKSRFGVSWGHRAGRALVVAVMGISPGVGATHTAIALAHALFRSSRKIAVVEMNAKSEAFERLAAIVEGVQKQSGNPPFVRRFRIAGVEYVRAPSRPEYIELLNDTFNFIICDLGSARSQELMEEFKRADLSVIVGSGAEWKSGELERFAAIGSRETAGRNLIYCLPLAASSTVRRLRKSLQTEKVYSIPVENDPFSPGQETTAALQALCSELLPRAVRSKRTSMLGRNRWKGND